MKQFNLEEYLKNPSKKVVTKEGKTIKRILCTDARGNYPIVALVEEGAYDNALSYTKDGKLYAGETNLDDLFFASEKYEGWLNIYRSDECGFYIRGNSPYESKEKADKVAKANPKTFFTTIKIEWEE